MHPQLQAELEFGLEQSADRTIDGMLELIDLMLDQGPEWRTAEAQIRDLRDRMSESDDDAATALMAVAASEVDFSYAMWSGDYVRALEQAVAVVDGLAAEDTRAYRAWWRYLAGVAAWLAGRELQIDDMADRASRLFAQAARDSRTVAWLARLAYAGDHAPSGEVDPEVAATVDRAHAALSRLGFSGMRFARETGRTLELLDDDHHRSFEQGLEQLGEMLGFDTSRPRGHGAPDGVWLVSDTLAFSLEAKTEEQHQGTIGSRTAQQAAGHAAWAAINTPLADDAEIVPLLISWREELGEGARAHVDDVLLVSPDSVRALARRVIGALTRVRATTGETAPAQTREALREALQQAGVLPRELTVTLAATPLVDLPDS